MTNVFSVFSRLGLAESRHVWFRTSASSILFFVIIGGSLGSLYAAEKGISATPAQPNFSPDAKYADDVRIYQGAPSIERAPNGRLWAAWYGDCAIRGDNLHNFVMLATSKDDGKTWSPIRMVLDPDGCGPVRAFDPFLLSDTKGKLWLFWAQDDRLGENSFTMFTENPGDENPVWSKPQLISSGAIAGRPTLLRDGSWIATVRNWRDEKSCRVISSKNSGTSWETIGSPIIPDKNDRNKNESMIVERKDGSLWMLVRTSYGIGESISRDGGKTWTELKPSNIPNAQARFFISRLKSGKLLLLRQNNPKEITNNSHLSAFLSDDDGKTWGKKGLLIDERGHACYPDAIEGKDGKILVIYEMGRWSDKEILMTALNEQDILNGVFNVIGDKLMLVNKGKAKPPTPPGLSGIPVLPDFSPKPEYADSLRLFQGVPSIERAPNGRLWATWYGGGPSEDMHSYVMLATSMDDGRSWSPIKLVVDPDGCGPLRAFDPCLWHDPQGRMWLFWGQKDDFAMNNIAMVTENSGDENPAWSKPRLISPGVMLNKPTVLKNGDWLLPTCIWRHERSSRIICSKDKGKTFELIGSASIPRREDRNGDENMIIERKDGSLWMLVRTGYGMGESISKDGGKTWTDVGKSSIPHAEARFFIRRLKSGRLLLIRHNAPEIIQRSHLTAFLSDDDGKTWSKGLILDERGGVSYPDAIEGPAGEIHMIYDYLRTNKGQILMCVFSEKDVEKGEFSPDARKRIVINQATGENPYRTPGK